MSINVRSSRIVIAAVGLLGGVVQRVRQGGPLPKLVLIGVAGLLILGTTATALILRMGKDPESSQVPSDLTVESLKANASNPGKAMDTMRSVFRRNDLTEEQRRQVGENMRTVREAIFDERIDRWYAASPEQRNAVLDEQIAEFEKMRKEWESRRKEWEQERAARREREAASQPSGESGDRGRSGDGRPGGDRRFGRPQNQQERKARSETRSPDRRARQMAYFNAVRQRMAERGISLPSGRLFGPGGPGPGGPGGPPPRRAN